MAAAAPCIGHCGFRAGRSVGRASAWSLLYGLARLFPAQAERGTGAAPAVIDAVRTACKDPRRAP